jgi:tetratricopeptide (TPR) repeat protein
MWFVINFITFFFFQYLLIILQEFGHALTARMVGFRVFSLRIGYGKTIFETSLFGIPVIINALPFIGLTTAVPRTESLLKLRLGLYVFAGPSTHIFFLAVVYVISPDSFYLGYVVPKALTGFAPIEMLNITNILLLAVNLFPHRVVKPMGEFITDGYHLLKILFTKQPSLKEYQDAVPRLEALEHMRRGEVEKAIAIYQRLLAAAPGNDLLRHDLAIANLHRGEYEQARRLFIEVFDTEEFEKPVKKILLMNNIAWVSAVLNRPEWLEQADDYSQRAYLFAPNLVNFMGTRGTVLIRLGRYKEGIDLLKKAYRYQSTNEARAFP